MRITEFAYPSQTRTLLTESWSYLTEDQKIYLGRFETELWPLMEELKMVLEADLTVDQIRQIFQSAEDVTANFGGRTKLGKVGAAAKLPVDAMKAVNKKVNELGRLLQDTKPVKNFDAQFEKLKGDIVAKAGDNNKLIDMVRKYGEWAKANPGKSAFAIGVLTAAASFAAGPGGGAAVGFLLRSASELTKGEKLSTVAGKAAKTAAIGALVGGAIHELSDTIADNIANANMDDIEAQAVSLEHAEIEKAIDQVDAAYKGFVPDNIKDYVNIKMSGHINNFHYNYDVFVSPEQLDSIKTITSNLKSMDQFSPEWVDSAAKFHAAMEEIQNSPAQGGMRGYMDAIEAAKTEGLSVEQLEDIVGQYETAGQAAEKFKQYGGALAAATQAGVQQADQIAKASTKAAPADPKDETSEGIIEAFCFDGEMLVEADTIAGITKRGLSKAASKVGDVAKKGASKGMAAAKKGMKNVSFKVTADKLAKKWKEIGSPTDMASILKLLGKFGITTDQLGEIGKQANVDLGSKVPDAEPEATDSPEEVKSKTGIDPEEVADVDIGELANILKKSPDIDAIKAYLSS